MRRASLVLSLIALAGCGAQTAAGRSEAAPQFWRPTAGKEAWTLAGHMDTSRVPDGLSSRPRHVVTIRVNGVDALRGEMPRDRQIELAGRAEDAALVSICTPRIIARATLQVSCLVLVNNERAGTLTFTAGTRATMAVPPQG